MPTVPLMTLPPPSLSEIGPENQQSLRGALQSETAASSVSQGNFCPPSTDRTHREVSSPQKPRNKYKRLKVIIDWIVWNKIHNGTHLKS